MTTPLPRLVRYVMCHAYCAPACVGGIAIGAAINEDPGCFVAAIMDVPFLDVLSTMSDPTLPLVTKERRQWGDPTADPDAYDYILSYSPYDNLDASWLKACGAGVARQEDGLRVPAFPHVLLTSSLYDARVPYFEPAKYAAKLRMLQARTSRAVCAGTQSLERTWPVVLLQTAMTGGHGASSAGSERLAVRAQKYGFLMWSLGISVET